MQTLFKYTEMQDDDLDEIVKAVDVKSGSKKKQTPEQRQRARMIVKNAIIDG